MDDNKSVAASTVFHSAYATLSRPTTAAVMRMLNKIAPLYARPGKPHKKYSAGDIQKLIEKVNKTHKKMMAAHKQFLKAFSSWGTDLPGPETALMVREFVELMECVGVAAGTQADRFNTLKVHLGAVATRETRQQDLLGKHNALQRRFDAAALKHGPQAAQASLVLDEIEENEYNLKLIEQQLVRTASASLREAFSEYLLWLQESTMTISRASNGFAAVIREADEMSARRTERASGPPSGLRLPGSGFDRHSEGGKSNKERREERRDDRRELIREERNRELREVRVPERQPAREERVSDRREFPREEDSEKREAKPDWPIYDLLRYERNLEGWG